MMTNLFSIFDPSTVIFSFNWMTSMIVITMIPTYYWMMNSRYMIMWMSMLNKLNKEFSMLMSKMSNKGTTLMFVTLFSMIMLNNITGLFPHLFTSTSHLSMTLSVALPIWLGFMLFGWIKKTESMFTHLVPTGTPNILMPFMVCIESISNLIRPGTLSVRLTANMIAGHLIMTLLGNTTMTVSTKILPVLLIIQMTLLILEIAVAVIQGYVFAVLSTLYASEVN